MGDLYKQIVGGLGGGAPQVQPINPNTAPGQPATLPPQGGAPPPPQAAGAPPSPGAPAMPTTMNIAGMGNVPLPQQSILDNPTLHGLLAMYAGFAGSPRAQGMGGAIRNAIGGGMQAYDAARAAQFTPYKTMAELQKAGAETMASQARADLETQKAEQIRAIKGQNQRVAAYLKTQADQATDPIEKQMLEMQSGLVALDVTKGYDPNDAVKGALDAAQIQRTRAEAGLTTAKIPLVGEQIKTEGAKRLELGARAGEETATAGLRGAETQQVAPLAQATIGEKGALQKKTEAETLAMPQVNQAKIALDNANAALAQQRTLSEPSKQKAAAALAEKNLRAAYAAQQVIGENVWNQTIGAMYPGAKFGQSYDDFRKSVIGAGTTAPAAGGAAGGGLPAATVTAMKSAGYTPTGNRYPDGRWEVLDKDGNPHAY